MVDVENLLVAVRAGYGEGIPGGLGWRGGVGVEAEEGRRHL